MKHLIKKLLREGLLSEITDETYELLQTKYNNSRVIMSNEEKIIFRNNPEQKIHFKPKGLWYGIGTSWVDWVRNNQSDWEEDYIHIIDVDLTKIKVIRNYQELIEFNNQYGTKENHSADIDWVKVSKDYSGIEIAPYIYKARFDREVFWYYAWDVASGCIWDSAAIKSIENLNKEKNPVEEGIMANWLTAGALILGGLTNSSLAQTYKNSDEKTKINILDKIKSGAESGNEKLNILYNKIKKEAETTNQNTTTNNDFSKEDFELEAKKLGGVVGVGKSTDLAVSKKMALSDARSKLGDGIQKNGHIVDEQVIKDSNEQYITYIIYKI